MIEYILGATIVSGLTYLITKKSNKNTFTLTSDTSTKSIFPKPPKPRLVREDSSDKKPPKEKTINVPNISSLDLNGIDSINHIRLEGSSDVIIRPDRIITDTCALLDLTNCLCIKTINHTRMNGKVYIGGNFIGSDYESSGSTIKEIPLEEKIIKLDNFMHGMHISRISLKGSGSLIFEGLTFNHELAVVLEGSGDIKFRNCTMFDAGMEVKGSGDIIMDNDCNAHFLSLTVKGSGDITIHESCKLNIVKKQIQGSGDITILTNYKKL